jgi:hypothetical protein
MPASFFVDPGDHGHLVVCSKAGRLVEQRAQSIAVGAVKENIGVLNLNRASCGFKSVIRVRWPLAPRPQIVGMRRPRSMRSRRPMSHETPVRFLARG